MASFNDFLNGTLNEGKITKDLNVNEMLAENKGRKPGEKLIYKGNEEDEIILRQGLSITTLRYDGDTVEINDYNRSGIAYALTLKSKDIDLIKKLF